MYFDGAFLKDGVGARIVLISPNKKIITQYFKLDFEVTHNVAKYEALILGLELAKSLKVQNLEVYNDLELIVKQIKNICQTKHPRLIIEMKFEIVKKIIFKPSISHQPQKKKIFMLMLWQFLLVFQNSQSSTITLSN